MADHSFPKQMRLRSRGEFRRVYERRCSVGDNLLRLVGELSDLAASANRTVGFEAIGQCGCAESVETVIARIISAVA